MGAGPYVVKQGDHLLQLALANGFDADAVWNDSQHDSLRDQGRTPHLLKPGDTLYFPEPRRTKLTVKTGKSHTFVVQVPKMNVSVTFVGKELANAACTVRFGQRSLDATTDADGKLSVQVPVNVSIVDVEFTALGYHQRLKVGHLDPVTVPSGQIQRLQNLGYLPRGDDDQTLRLSRAFARYQRANKLSVSGAADDDTVQHLEDAHGC